MQELRLVLIVVGALAIAALLLHGFMTSRKERRTKFSEKPLGKLKENRGDDDGFDQDGIGAVRVVNQPESKQTQERKEPGMVFGEKPDSDPLFDMPGTLHDDDDVPSLKLDPEDIHSPASSVPKDEKTQSESVEPASTEVMPEPQVSPEEVLPAEETETTEPEATPEEPKSDVLVLHVHAANGEVFSGVDLINSFEQHGLHYGELDIYHRHTDLAGTGKVLFSIANMVKPGNLIISSPDTYETPGISFFMTLPCYGEPDQNFKLMLQTAQQIADELGGLVLDESRAMLTPQKIDAYKQRIRDFSA